MATDALTLAPTMSSTGPTSSLTPTSTSIPTMLPIGGIVAGVVVGSFAIAVVIAFAWYKARTHRPPPVAEANMGYHPAPDTQSSQIYPRETSSEGGNVDKQPIHMTQPSEIPSVSLRYPDTIPSGNLSTVHW